MTEQDKAIEDEKHLSYWDTRLYVSGAAGIKSGLYVYAKPPCSHGARDTTEVIRRAIACGNAVLEQPEQDTTGQAHETWKTYG